MKNGDSFGGVGGVESLAECGFHASYQTISSADGKSEFAITYTFDPNPTENIRYVVFEVDNSDGTATNFKISQKSKAKE